MLEEDLSLDRCKKLEFEKHHPKYCSLNGSACEDVKRPLHPNESAARMLAHVLSQGHHEIDELWKPPEVLKIFTGLWMGYRGLVSDLANEETEFGGVLRRPESTQNAVRGALALYSLNQIDEARCLLSLIHSKDHFERALLKRSGGISANRGGRRSTDQAQV
jgi:hypothetical protein